MSKNFLFLSFQINFSVTIFRIFKSKARPRSLTNLFSTVLLQAYFIFLSWLLSAVSCYIKTLCIHPISIIIMQMHSTFVPQPVMF